MTTHEARIIRIMQQTGKDLLCPTKGARSWTCYDPDVDLGDSEVNVSRKTIDKLIGLGLVGSRGTEMIELDASLTDAGRKV